MQEFIVNTKADTTFGVRVEDGAITITGMDWDNRSSECGFTLEVLDLDGEPVGDEGLVMRIIEAIPGKGGFKL